MAYHVGPNSSGGMPRDRGAHQISPLLIRAGDRVAFIGDSITQFLWHAEASGFVSLVNAARNPDITYTTHGVVGNTVAQIDARVNADVVALNPQPNVVVVEAGINDVVNGVTATTRAAAMGVLAKLTAGIPNVRIMWVGCFCYGENAASDASYNGPQAFVDACTADACVAYGASHVDIRTPVRAALAANWAGANLNSGVLTADGIHPNATGNVLMGTTAYAQVI